MQELHDLARELVATPSHESEAAAGDAIEDWLRQETASEVVRDDAGRADGRGGNVVARKGSGDVSLALVGHHDVVPPDESQTTADGGYVVREDDGRLYGRGSADMKGSVAAAMLAFRDAAVPDDLELVFASFVGEEDGGVGARYAIDHGFSPDYAVVGEGSTSYSGEDVTDVAIAHRGRRASTVVARGVAAHASEPEAGANAIYRACDAVEVVRGLDAPESEVMGESVTGSLVATMVSGGSAWNVVPERCEVTVDERTVPGDRADLARVEAIDGVTWQVDQDLPPMACSDRRFVGAVLDAAIETQDVTPERVFKPHATDAGWLAQAGTECVIYGASEPGQAHTKTESVSLAVLDRCYETYRRVVESPGGEKLGY